MHGLCPRRRGRSIGTICWEATLVASRIVLEVSGKERPFKSFLNCFWDSCFWFVEPIEFVLKGTTSRTLAVISFLAFCTYFPSTSPFYNGKIFLKPSEMSHAMCKFEFSNLIGTLVGNQKNKVSIIFIYLQYY